MDWPVVDGVLELGDLPVERGGVIRGARLSWQAHGTLNASRDNVIVYPCSYTATHEDLSWLVGPDLVLDPTRYLVVIPDMFSNGLSSSASTDPDHPALVTAGDNVRAQHRLLTEHLGVTGIAAAYGFSMGAIQAYHWASLYPDLVERAIIVCGSARTAVHNRVFLSGLLQILRAAPEHRGGGRFSAQPHAAIRAFAHVYAGWGLSQDFYRAGLHLAGHPDLATFLAREWEDGFAPYPAADLYAQAMTWSDADISATERFGGDLPAALAAIRARVLLLPGATDLYFRVADNEAELEHLADARLAPIPSIWGHAAGSPQGVAADLEFLRTQVRAWLSD